MKKENLFTRFINKLGFYWPNQVIDLKPIHQYIKLRNIKTPEQFRECLDKDWEALNKGNRNNNEKRTSR